MNRCSNPACCYQPHAITNALKKLKDNCNHKQNSIDTSLYRFKILRDYPYTYLLIRCNYCEIKIWRYELQECKHKFVTKATESIAICEKCGECDCKELKCIICDIAKKDSKGTFCRQCCDECTQNEHVFKKEAK